jgi:NADH-ubiquinone oxidoreductase chain 2
MAVSLIITLFSFIGVPPLVGFFAKQMILTAAIDNGYIFITLIAILTSVISAVYYLVIVKNIFFEKSVYSLHNNTLTTTISSSLTLPISVMSMLLLLFMFTDINYYI